MRLLFLAALLGGPLIAQPPAPTQGHLEIRRESARTPSARVRGDTLVMVLAQPVPRPAPLTGVTDSLVFLFVPGVRDTVYQLEAGRRFVYPPGLWAVVRNLRAAAVDAAVAGPER